jgi:hypothetical protein
MAACCVGISSKSHQVSLTKKTARGTESRRTEANQREARRFSMAAAKKHAETTAMMDIERQGN